MNCPVCDRSLAPTLSICPSCGAMMHDSVREELQPKISSGIAPRFEAKAEPMRERMMPRPALTLPAVAKTVAPVVAKRIETAGLVAHKTSPTLVGFQSKNPSLPDWRVQLQNAVQQRKGSQNRVEENGAAHFPVNGGAALKAEVVRRTVPEPAPVQEISDPRVANAMRRIEESRKAFQEVSTTPAKAVPVKPTTVRPFGVVPQTFGSTAAATAPARTIVPQKPKLVESLPVAEKRDTNKLPPIDSFANSFITAPDIAPDAVTAESLPVEFAEINRIHISAGTGTEMPELVETISDEIEDLAPFSMRFGAGLFDLIIGAFAAMLLLSPIAFTNGDWFTSAGLLTFAGTCAIVIFLYMTICLGFYGKTLGMRLFSLELVDAVENEYPTLHQAAINSSIFLLSIGFGGLGFLTVFFNEENRAAHDLLSGTIIVREF